MKNQRKMGVILSYLVFVLNLFIGIIFIPILLGYISQSEYGLYRLMGSIIIYFSVMDFGLGTIVTRYYSRYRVLNDKIGMENSLALSAIIFMISIMLILLAGGIFYNFIDEIFVGSLCDTDIMKAKKIFVLLLFNISLIILTSLCNALIVSHEKFVFLKGSAILQILLQPILIIQMMRISPEAFSIVAVQTACNMFFLMGKAMYCFIELKIKIKYHCFDWELLKGIGRLSSGLFVVAIFDQIFWQANQIILGIYMNTIMVAIYSIAIQICLNCLPIANIFMNIFLPKVTEMVTKRESNAALSEFFIKIGRIQFIIISAFLSILILYGKEFISLWAGASYVEAYYISIILMIPFAVGLIQNMGVTILQAKNQYGFRGFVCASMGGLNIILAIPAAIHFGAVGCAVVAGFCYLVQEGIVMNIYYARVIGIDIKRFWYEIGKIFIVVIFCLIGGIALRQILFSSILLDFLIKVVCYFLLYCCMTWKFAFNAYEKSLIVQIYRDVKRMYVNYKSLE